MVCPPDTSIHINTKDSKLWKSQRKRATETCDTWFYLLWFRVDTQSYLEPYRVYFKSLFIMFLVFFFSWAGRCSSQYYHVVDDCTATFCFCYIWMSFFAFILNIFKYMWILVFLFSTLIFVSKPGFRIFGNDISTEVISSTKRHCNHVFLLLYKMKDRAAVQLRVVTGMFQLGKTGDLHFPLYIPYMSVCHRLTFAVFAKTRAEWWWCTQQWGAFLLSNSQTSIFSFLIAVYTVCLHNPMPSFTIPSLHILYLIGSLPLSHLLVGRVKLREGFGLLIKDNGVDTFHTNGFLMGFSSSPGLCQVHWVSVVFVKGDVVVDKPVEEWMREPKTGLCNVTVT